MRILYVSYDDLSGSYAWTVHVAAVVNRLSARGHEVHLLAPEGPLSPELHVETWPLTRPRSFAMKLLWMALGSFLELMYYRVKLKPDVIYVRGIHPTPAPLLAGLLLPGGVVCEVNGLLELETRSAFRRWVVRWTHRLAAGRARALVAVSPRLKEELCARYGARPDKVRVVPNGADCERFRPSDRAEARRRLGLVETSKIALFVGSFYEHHALDVLVECAPRVMERIPRAQFLLVGDGATRKSMEKTARERFLDAALVFTGEIPHARVPDYIAAADVCLYFLRSRAGFSPLKLYEYMASGRPVVVAADNPEIVEFMRRHEIGVAVPLEAGPAGEAIARLLQDPAACERYGKRGRELAESTYNWNRACDEVERVLVHG